jgi:hypothetical protein
MTRAGAFRLLFAAGILRCHIGKRAIVRCPTERLQGSCSMRRDSARRKARPRPPIPSPPKYRVRPPIPRVSAPGRWNRMLGPCSTLSLSPLSQQQSWSFSLASASFPSPGRQVDLKTPGPPVVTPGVAHDVFAALHPATRKPASQQRWEDGQCRAVHAAEIDLAGHDASALSQGVRFSWVDASA